MSAGINARKAGASPAKAAFIAEKAGADAAIACIQDDFTEIKAAELEGLEAAAADIRKEEAMGKATSAVIKATAERISKEEPTVKTVTSKANGNGDVTKTHVSLNANATPFTCNKSRDNGKAAFTAAMARQVALHPSGNLNAKAGPKPVGPRKTTSHPRPWNRSPFWAGLSGSSNLPYGAGQPRAPAHQKPSQTLKRNPRNSNIGRRMN